LERLDLIKMNTHANKYSFYTFINTDRGLI